MGIVGVKRGVSMPGARSSSTAPSDFAAFRATCAEATPKVYRDGRGAEVTTAWLMTVARSKLVDHWRRAEREQRRLRLAWNGRDEGHVPWSEDSSITRALTALRQLEPAHQAVLTLRYLDNLPVAEVARALGRSVHATESLLIRAKSTFRRAYAGCSDD